ncbi:glycosyl transferase family 1 [Opitutaceae bacterium TAV5]|nr:glycosyl transferase family 1 [Opitutaceae bacterium TAV5]
MIVFLNRFYHPSTTATGQLLTDLAEGLAARGHAVRVVTSRHDASLPEDETHNGVRIHRIGTPARWRGFARITEFRAFHVAARRRLPSLLAPADTVVALTDPPLVGVTAAQACRASGARLVHWVQDIYPELLAAAGAGWPALPLVALLRLRRDRAWREATRCVTLGGDMAALLRARGVPSDRLAIIPNWAPAGLAPPPPETVAAMRARWGLGDRFIVAYSGNLGRVHDLDVCLRVAEALRSDSRFAFVFIGEGARKSRLQRAVAARGLENVVFRPHESRRHLAASLAAADAHWVTLRDSCGSLVFPSKLYGIAAVGRPVLFAGPPGGELARQVTAHRLGIAAAPDDTARFVRTLHHWIETPAACEDAARASLAFARTRDLPSALDAWEEVLRLPDEMQTRATPPGCRQPNTHTDLLLPAITSSDQP